MRNIGVDKCLKRYYIWRIKDVVINATWNNNEKLRREFLNAVSVILTDEENVKLVAKLK